MGSVIGISRGSDLHTIDELLPTLKTGDLILFQFRGFACSVIQLVTRCPWNHVGMVIRSPELCNNQPLLWESTYQSYHYNIIFRQRINGVNLSLLEPHLRNFHGYCCAVRPLQYPESMAPVLQQRALQSVKKYNGGQYDNNLVDMLISIQGSPMGDETAHRTDSSFFCSHLVAQTYIDMGVLPNDGKPAMEYIPMDFSIEGDTCFSRGFQLPCTLFLDTKEEEEDCDNDDDRIHLRHYGVTLQQPLLGNDPT